MTDAERIASLDVTIAQLKARVDRAIADQDEGAGAEAHAELLSAELLLRRLMKSRREK